MLSIIGTSGPIQCRQCHQLQTNLLKRFQMHFRQRLYMSTRTHYEVLSLSRTASKKEIKDAFIKLSKLTHPDLNPDDPAKHKQFVRINEAYETLGSHLKRKEYDKTLLQGRRYGPFTEHNAYAHTRHHSYQEHARHHEKGTGRNPFKDYSDEFDSQRAGGYYDSKTGKHHLYEDATTASMSNSDWQNVLTYGKYLALFVCLMNVLYMVDYVKKRNIAVGRHQSYLRNPGHFYDIKDEEEMKRQKQYIRKEIEKRRKKKKDEKQDTLDKETLQYDVSMPVPNK